MNNSVANCPHKRVRFSKNEGDKAPLAIAVVSACITLWKAPLIKRSHTNASRGWVAYDPYIIYITRAGAWTCLILRVIYTVWILTRVLSLARRYISPRSCVATKRREAIHSLVPRRTVAAQFSAVSSSQECGGGGIIRRSTMGLECESENSLSLSHTHTLSFSSDTMRCPLEGMSVSFARLWARAHLSSAPARRGAFFIAPPLFFAPRSDNTHARKIFISSLLYSRWIVRAGMSRGFGESLERARAPPSSSHLLAKNRIIKSLGEKELPRGVKWFTPPSENLYTRRSAL